MKNNIFAIIVLMLCLIAMPSWAMDDDSHVSVESDKSEDAMTSDWAPSDIFSIRAVRHQSDVEGTNEWSSSTSTESDDRKTFFVHIPNASAADFYRNIFEKYQFSIRHWRRHIALKGTLEENQKTFSSCQLGEELCRVMRRVLKKFRATQTLMRIGNDDCRLCGLIVQLNTAKEHPVEMITKYCKRSRYVYQVFANKDTLRHYMGTPANIPLNAVLTVVKPVE